jgi:hypothetical protein
MAADAHESPGWHAIDKALEPLYGGEDPPFHYAPPLPAMLGGADPIDGISVYRSNAYGTEHWHFITYGFSELHAKETSDPAVSGYGFELTFRLVRSANEEQPPGWVFSFLQNIGRYVFSTGNVFEPGHYMNLNGPIALGSPSAIEAILFTHDPALPEEMETPNGTVRFLQIVGITLDEVLAVKQWNSESFLTLLDERIPGALTDAQRESLLRDPAFAARVQAGIAADGSSTAVLFPSVASFRQEKKQIVVTLGANGVRDFLQVFPGRLPFERPLSIVCGETLIVFTPSSTAACKTVDDEPTLQIETTRQFASELMASLKAQAGEYRFPAMPELLIVIERSAITDRDGTIVEWVG